MKNDFGLSKTIMKEIKALDKGLSYLASMKERYSTAIMKNYTALKDETVHNTFNRMPIDELTKAKMGIRVQPLKDAGLTTIGALMKFPTAKLEGISGIGPKSAAAIRLYLQEIVKNVQTTTRVRINADSPSKYDEELVKNLYYYQKMRELGKPAQDIYESSHDNIEKLIKNSKPTRNWFLWMLASDEKKEYAIQNLQALKTMLDGQYRSNANALINRQQEILKADHAKIWGDYKKSAAGYYAALDNVRRTQTPKKNSKAGESAEEVLTNGLPEELAIEISKVELDLRGLKKELRPYQKLGVQYILNQGAVLLGDEMGLGKTAQAIASMVCLRNAGETHFLVVCPASVLVNWLREIEDWSDLRCHEIHGSDSDEEMDDWLQNGGVCVTTYETLAKLAMPADFKYSMLVVDEAHYVKNPNANRTRNLVYFRQHTARALFMSGTPLENKVEEMCTLIGYLQPQVAQDIAKYTNLGAAAEFRKRIAPVYFRRTQEDVLSELPEKVELEDWCRMTNSEFIRYREFVMGGSFNQMRQVSFEVEDLSKSSKGVRLQEIVEESVENGRKIIVFSFFLNTMDKVVKILQNTTATTGPSNTEEPVKLFGPISGAINAAKRQEIIDEFSAWEGGAVLLSQIQAGGTGLNIQAASVIVFTEPQLKPSIESQAIGRAFRMGQINTVMVHRLLLSKSVDERIRELLNDKQVLFDNFADESVSGQESLSDLDSGAENSGTTPGMAAGTATSGGMAAGGISQKDIQAMIQREMELYGPPGQAVNNALNVE